MTALEQAARELADAADYFQRIRRVYYTTGKGLRKTRKAGLVLAHKYLAYRKAEQENSDASDG